MSKASVKTIVVEDEILLLRNIKKKIVSVSPDFEILGEATNGKEAWALIEKLHPDVVFTDIRMPIMDGLALSGLIQEKYPDIYTVIISGYDDFEYARTALTNKVYDYLLKPVKAEPLKNLLFSLREKVLRKKAAYTHALLEAQLNGVTLSPDTQNTFPQQRAVFSCFLICFGNLLLHCSQNSQNDTFNEQYNDIPWNTLLRIPGLSVEKFYVFPQRFPNMKLIIVENPDDEPTKTAHLIFDCLKKRFPDTIVNLSCSLSPVIFEGLRTEYILLRRLLFSSLTIGHSAVFVSGKQLPLLPPAVLSSSTSQYLQSLIQTKNVSGAAQSLRHLFQDWMDKQYPQQWIEKILLQLFMIFQQCLYFSDDDYEQMKQSVFSSLEMISDFGTSTDTITKELLHWIVLNKTVPTEISTVIEEMDTYIRGHYREALNISELAGKYHFNHSYLTRIFKKEKGQSPLRLINELRIQDARDLLMNTSLSIREISEVLGFTDQHYFSRIFKDFTGLTPKEYRLR